MLVEEEEILDPHQGSSLPYAAEEAIDDAGGEVGVETGGGRGPDACAYHDALEEERDGQAPEETGEGDNEESARSYGEEVANNSALDGGLCQMPLAVLTWQLIARNSKKVSSALIWDHIH